MSLCAWCLSHSKGLVKFKDLVICQAPRWCEFSARDCASGADAVSESCGSCEGVS